MSIDYNQAYADYLLCKNCGRETAGVEDFMHKTSKKITKTCQKCRTSSLTSVNKTHPYVKKPPRMTAKEKIQILTTFVKDQFDQEKMDSFKEKYPDLGRVLTASKKQNSK